MNRKNKLAMRTGAALMLAAAMLPTAASADGPAPTSSATSSAAQAEIWTMEQAIYAGRAKGDISTYADNVAAGYVAWPPTVDAPLRVSAFNRAKTNSQEQLTMKFMDFSRQGDVAIIYYQTHRTRLADGTAADDTFDVTHTWVRQDGKWRVLGGMARKKPRP